MNDLLKSAEELREGLPRQIMAHRVSAEYHRHWDMVLGGASMVLTTLVGSAIFTGLVSQLGLDGKGTIQNPFAGQGMDWFYLAVIFLSILAPILSTLHNFMHHAEDAATHRASVEGYANVLRRLTGFLAKYEGSDPSAKNSDEAQKEYDDVMKEYDDVMKEYNVVQGKSLTLTKKAYEAAEELMQRANESQRVPNNNLSQADAIATPNVQGERESNNLKKEIYRLKIAFGVLVAIDLFMITRLARSYATPHSHLVVFHGVAVLFITAAIVAVYTSQKRVGKGASNKLKEKIGWLKVVFSVLVATDIFLLAWLVQSFATPEAVPFSLYGLTVIIVTGAIVAINRKAYHTIDKLEEF